MTLVRLLFSQRYFLRHFLSLALHSAPAPSAGSSQALVTRKSITQPKSLFGLVLAAPKSSTGHYHLQFLLTEVRLSMEDECP